MTGKELKVFLQEHLVPKKWYKIGGSHNKRICMEKSGDGWDVYFREKKNKISLVHYDNEGAACCGMKEELRKLMLAMYGLTWA